MNPLAIVRFTALYIAAVFSILLTGCILIAHDISAPFRQVLVSLTGHHWITVSILSVLIYLAFLYLLCVRGTIGADGPPHESR